MEPLSIGTALLEAVWRSSWQASVLVFLVYFMQALFRGKLSPQGRSLLWLIVIARLVLPVAPQSGFSIFNVSASERLASMARVREGSRRASALPGPPASVNEASSSTLISNPTFVVPDAPFISSKPKLAEPRVSPGRAESIKMTRRASTFSELFWSTRTKALLGLCWAVGVFFLLARLGWANWRFHRILRRQPELAEAHILLIWNECRKKTASKKSIRLVVTDEVDNPALHGFWNTHLLLPERLISSLTPAEWRHVFFHELAHLQRRDIGWNWLQTILQTVHWFNPVLFWTFRRMRLDRELACDARALMHLGEEERNSYGNTIIKLLEAFSMERRTVGMIGILEDRGQTRMRIAMIARFRKSKPWHHWLTVLMLFSLTVFGLTDATNSQSGPVSKKPAKRDGEASLEGAENRENPADHWRVSGKVVDAFDHTPIARFKLTPGYIYPSLPPNSPPLWQAHRSIAASNGVFTALWPKTEAKLVVKVEAAGYEPIMSKVMSAPDNEQDFFLPSSKDMFGDVISMSGKPLQGIRVVWLDGHQQVYFNPDGELRQMGNDPIGMLTDEQGRFTLPNLLGGKGLVAIGEQGFALLPLPDASVPIQISLKPWGKVSGTLLRDNKAVAEEYLDIKLPEGMALNFQIGLTAKTDEKGHFEFAKVPAGEVTLIARHGAGDRSWTETELQTLAVKPAETVVLNLSVGSVAKQSSTPQQGEASRVPPRGPPLSGKVFLPNGEPAASARVGLGSWNGYLTLRESELGGSGWNITRALGDGTFSLAGPVDPEMLNAAHKEGFASLVVTNSTPQLEVHLKKWGRIEGIVKKGKDPLPNGRLSITFFPSGKGFPLLPAPEGPIEADADGKFSFDFIPPGKVKVWRVESIEPLVKHNSHGVSSQQTSRYTHSLNVDVSAGETTKVVIGGSGRRISAKFDFASPAGNVDWKWAYVFLRGNYVDAIPFKFESDYLSWREQCDAKPVTIYALRHLQDNAFATEDVPPGDYELIAFLDSAEDRTPPGEFGRDPYSDLIATFSAPITIGDGKMDEEVNLGSHTLAAVGDPRTLIVDNKLAPDLSFYTPDGMRHGLKDYRGKYVILYCWSKEGANTRMILEKLKTSTKLLAQNKQIVQIGLSTDQEMETPKRLVDEMEIPWLCGFFARNDERRTGIFWRHFMPGSQHGDHLPPVVLIDPEGKIMDAALPTDEIVSRLKEVGILAKNAE